MTATDYARSIEETPEAFSWRDLERNAFAPYPAIPPLFDALMAHIDGQKISQLRSWLGVFGGLLIAVMHITPMITAGILIVGMRLGQESGTMLAWAGIFASCHIIFRAREWVMAARGGEPHAPQQALLTAVNVLFAALTAAMGYLLASGLYPPPGAWLCFALFVIMTVACLASVIMMRVRGRAAARGELAVAVSPESALLAGIAQLSAAEHDAIRNDLSAAINIVADASAITESEKASALTQTLGNLTRSRWTATRLYGPPKRSAGAPGLKHE